MVIVIQKAFKKWANRLDFCFFVPKRKFSDFACAVALVLRNFGKQSQKFAFFSKEKKFLFYFYAIIDGWARHISWWWKRCAKIWSFQICKWNCLKWWCAKSTPHFLINSCNFSKMLQKQKSKFMAAKKSWFWKRNAFMVFAHFALLSFTDQISEFHKI